ncbi:hypothetical protein RhiirC2_774808 [Rhizophagus irregularis]|uniref:Crinkler family protein n=1 Tax=Rhizophagus irregularis TaxID=588596 RepID=A0A2N1NKJ6_9GLOM|nr:hypothetical protein RhiirC2_774808 [Rhizophagus irregularis]
MKLWKIDISKFKPDSIEEQIKKEEVEELNPFNYLSNYFSDQAAADKTSLSRDIITKSIMSLVNLAEAYLENVHETYDLLKSLRRSSNKIATRKLVDTYDANFPLEGRDESIKILFKGRKGRNGICKRFEKRKSRDSHLHPIPISANGPGTGKSRLLQELPTLLREQAKNYTTDKKDVYIGQASVALRLIYEYFFSVTMNYGQFMIDHGKKSLEITNAIDVILKDVNKDRDEYNKIKFFVLGIDELNALHSLYDKNLDPVRNQVNLIVNAIGGINCSGKNVFHVSVFG